METIDKVQCITELEMLFRHYDNNASVFVAMQADEFCEAMIAHLEKIVGSTWKQNPLLQPLLRYT